MALPWLQIVQLVPSIVDVSRELMRKTKRLPAAPGGEIPPDAPDHALYDRLAALEENEQRQAELVGQMAEQIAKLTRAVTVLHQRVVWSGYAIAFATALAVAAMIVAIVT
jgi:hypothetical protein